MNQRLRLLAARLAVTFVTPFLAASVVAQGAAPAPRSQPGAAHAGAPPPRVPFDANAPAETQFKNIQVLKGIKASELRDAMEFIQGALGTGCGHCHTRGGMDKDDKPAKETARRMMKMVQGLNRDMFEGKNVVNCYTCHQGRERPVSTPSFEPAPRSADAFVKDAADPSAAAATPLPDAAAIIAKFVAAIGGKEALAKLPPLKMHATEPDAEHPSTIDMTWQAPASMIATMRSGAGEQAFVFTQASDGTAAWGRMGEQPPQDLHGLRRMSAMHAARLLPSVTFGIGTNTIETIASGTIKDMPVVIVKVTGADGNWDRLAFSTASGLLVRVSYEVPTPLGAIPCETDYADWKPTSGVLLPRTLHSKLPGEIGTTTIDDIQTAGSLAAATFAKP